MKTNNGQGYQPKTGAKCSCKRGQQRDNCQNCEGTGYVIDFVKIRARNTEKPLFETLGEILNPKNNTL